MGAKEERDRLILAALPGDVDQVAAATAVPRSTVYRRLVALHAQGRAHIERWAVRENGGKPNAVYAAGPGEDATYERKTAAQRAKDSRVKKALAAPPVQNDRTWLRPQDRRRALDEADRTAKTRDPMIEALFGPARRAA